MKKMIFSVAVVMTMIVSVSTYASVCEEGKNAHHHSIGTTHVATQGARCSGTVGCACTGFAPITNGKVWQEAYCKHCNHHRSCHK